MQGEGDGCRHEAEGEAGLGGLGGDLSRDSGMSRGFIERTGVRATSEIDSPVSCTRADPNSRERALWREPVTYIRRTMLHIARR